MRASLTKYQDRVHFATDEILTYNGRTIRGLALPEPVLKKFYRDNAMKWIPGLSNSKP